MSADGRQLGSTFVEVLRAVSFAGALAAIGMPNYLAYTEEGREAQCTANRHQLEAAERACALDNNGKPCLSMSKLIKSGYLDAKLTCTSGGKYVWIANHAGDPKYPSMGCSKHSFPVDLARAESH